MQGSAGSAGAGAGAGAFCSGYLWKVGKRSLRGMTGRGAPSRRFFELHAETRLLRYFRDETRAGRAKGISLDDVVRIEFCHDRRVPQAYNQGYGNGRNIIRVYTGKMAQHHSDGSMRKEGRSITLFVATDKEMALWEKAMRAQFKEAAGVVHSVEIATDGSKRYHRQGLSASNSSAAYSHANTRYEYITNTGAGISWTQKEDATLLRMQKSGTPYEVISQHLAGRTQQDCLNRAEFLLFQTDPALVARLLQEHQDTPGPRPRPTTTTATTTTRNKRRHAERRTGDAAGQSWNRRSAHKI